MKLLHLQHPCWVLFVIGAALVYAEEETIDDHINNNNNNSVPSEFKNSYHENLLRKKPTTSDPSVQLVDLASTTIVRPISSPDITGPDESITREGRIVVSGNNVNRTSDTTDFARNTVPVKEQAPTDPTVKKTEPPRKILRKPNPELKNKIRVDRPRYGGGPPGPDVSMLAYNAFTPQLVEEPTTERHIRKPFTTKSRPPPLSYLTSTADSPLPPTAWALTTLKGSSPSATVEHVKNIIPATASEPIKGSRPRTTQTSVKPIKSYWSSRLSSKIPSTSTYAVIETTEPVPTEELRPHEPLRTSPSATAEVPKPENTNYNKINEEKILTAPEFSSPDGNSTNNSIILNTEDESHLDFDKETQVIDTLKINETQIKTNKKVVTPIKEQNQTNTSNEIKLLKVGIEKNNTIKGEEPIENLNEAINKSRDEENQLAKVIENKYAIKPEVFEANNLNTVSLKKTEGFRGVVANHMTENYGNILTEKPFIETIKIKLNESKEVIAKNPDFPPSVTEFNKVKSEENIHDVDQENNYNTAVYPLGNIINGTKFIHNLKPMDLSSSMNQMETETKTKNDASMNAIASFKIPTLNNTNIVNETDQSTTSMTRATNATQPPVNATTEPNIVTISSMNLSNIATNISETLAFTMMSTTPLSTIKFDDDQLTTVVNRDISELGLQENKSTSTVSPEIITTQMFNLSLVENNTVEANGAGETIDVTKVYDNVTSVIQEDNTFKNVINVNTTSKKNDIKSIGILETVTKNVTTTELSTLPSEVTTMMPPTKLNNNSLNSISKHYELNQTNNDIKLGGELDLPIPTIASISSTLSPSTRSNYIKTTTEKLPPTTQKSDISEMFSELPTVTDVNIVKETTIGVQFINASRNQTNFYYENNNETESTTVSSFIFLDNDDSNEEDGGLMSFNATGNDTKFSIDTASIGNMTDHDIDDNGDDAVSDEKEMSESIPSNSTPVNLEETTISDILKNMVTTMITTEPPTTISPITNVTINTTMLVVTAPSIEDDGVTPVEDDNTGMEMEDYDTGVIMPMNVRLLVHATYQEMCSSKDLLIESIVRFFKTVADRSIDRKQIKILNLIRECITPYSTDNGVVPVHISIADIQGQYDKRLTDIFVTLVSQERLSFKYPITHVDKFIAHEMTMDAENQGSGTIIAAIIISSIAGLCLLVLTILLVIMRKRQRGFNYGQRCTPVSLDDYSLDNISVYNSVRRKAMRASKRSYGNPAFDDPTAFSNSLNFAGLAGAINDKAKLEEEFSKIPVITVKPDELLPGAEVKNRYANVIPLPETRVMLNGPNNNDVDQFINANFVKGAKGSEKFYVACQAPMKDTITDFWQMIWEQQSRIVIMLTDHHENGIEKCADYLPPSEVLDCHRVFGDLQVTLKKREVREKYIISSLQLKNLDSNLWREVTHMWYIGWPGRGVPEDLSSIIAFLIEARSYAKNGSPIVVHCSPGTGRTGTIVAIDIAIRDFETDRVVDIPRTVYNIRKDRAGAVQTSHQYIFIYQVLHLYATKLTGGGLDSI